MLLGGATNVEPDGANPREQQRENHVAVVRLTVRASSPRTRARQHRQAVEEQPICLGPTFQSVKWRRPAENDQLENRSHILVQPACYPPSTRRNTTTPAAKATIPVPTSSPHHGKSSPKVKPRQIPPSITRMDHLTGLMSLMF